MSRIFLITLGAIILATSGRADDKPVIPPNVHYKFIDDQLDATLRASLAAEFKKGGPAVVDLFQTPCIVAPGYWTTLSKIGVVKQPIPSTFSVPNTKTGAVSKLPGATVKNAEDLHRLAIQFATDVGTTPVIRRLTTNEISLLWALIPFDIEEPVYALDNGPHHYLIILLQKKGAAAGNFSVFWLDDLSVYTVDKPSGAGGPPPTQ